MEIIGKQALGFSSIIAEINKEDVLTMLATYLQSKIAIWVCHLTLRFAQPSMNVVFWLRRFENTMHGISYPCVHHRKGQMRTKPGIRIGTQFRTIILILFCKRYITLKCGFYSEHYSQ